MLFEVNSSINESERGKGFAKLSFTMTLETEPAAVRIMVGGEATLKGTSNEIDDLLAAEEVNGTPTVFLKIYQDVYPTMYLLCGTLDVPYPTPTLLHVNSIKSPGEVRTT